MKKGATSQIAYLFIRDSSATTGVGLTGLAYNSGSLVASYVRAGAARTAITLATQTASGAWSSGGFVEVDATNMPGVYRLDVPDAAFASGVDSVVIMLKGASNMEPVLREYELTAVDMQDGVRAGLTALPNAAAAASGGLFTRGTGAGQINQSANGQIDVNVAVMAANVMTAAAAASDLTTELQTGLATATALATAQADLDDIQTRLPAALVSGRIDASVGAMAANVMTAAAAASDLTTELQSGLATASSITTLTAYVDTEVAAIKAVTDKLDTAMEADSAVYRFTTNALEQAPTGSGSGLDAAGVRAAVGLASANLDTQLGALQADTDNIQTRIPAALVSGRMDSYTGAMGNNVMTAAAAASDLTTELQSGLATSTAVAAVATTLSEIVATLAAIPDSVWDEVVDGVTTARQSMRLANSANGGKVSGMGTDTVVLRDLADTKARVTATVDAPGNRSAVTRDLT